MSFITNIKRELEKHNILTVLLVINVSLFFIVNISKHILGISLIEYLALPLNLNELVIKFWTVLTYMFTHEGLGHVFYNLLLLYFTSQTFLNFLNEKKLLYVYIMSGLMGGLILLIFSILMPDVFSGSYLFGASAAVIGLVMSLGFYVPNLPVSLFGLIEMRYKYYAMLVFVVFTIIDFTVNTGGKISHFGGAMFGLLFGYLLRNGKDLSEMSLFKSSKKTKLKKVHDNKHFYNKPNSLTQQQMIDELLDKISKNGYDSLSKSEKELLFKLSDKK
jgi:membrane associated rhomboid family serine protease